MGHFLHNLCTQLYDSIMESSVVLNILQFNNKVLFTLGQGTRNRMFLQIKSISFSDNCSVNTSIPPIQYPHFSPLHGHPCMYYVYIHVLCTMPVGITLKEGEGGQGTKGIPETEKFCCSWCPQTV